MLSSDLPCFAFFLGVFSLLLFDALAPFASQESIGAVLFQPRQLCEQVRLPVCADPDLYAGLRGLVGHPGRAGHGERHELGDSFGPNWAITVEETHKVMREAVLNMSRTGYGRAEKT